MCISKIRKIKYGNSDESMLVLDEGLRLIRGINYSEQEKENYTIFAIPRTAIQPYLHLGSTF
jgi:hypothetical protein